MVRVIGIMEAILIASAIIVLAQGGNAQTGAQGTRPLQVLGPTGTMYDGNNANLQLPAEPNEYWARLWAGSSRSSATGTASSGSTAGVSSAGAQH